MSVSSISQSNVLGDDVLQMIFQQLDGKDLVKCEVVCRQWRDVLLSGTPWRRLFHRKIKCSHLWRKEQKKLEKNQLTLPTEQYRDVCRNLLQLERNLRIGQFKKSVYPVDKRNSWSITISDDYVAWGFVRIENDERHRGCAFLDTESMEITEILLVSEHQVLEGMAVRWGDFTSSEVEVGDPKNHWVVDVGNTEENDYIYREFSFGSERLVEYTRPYNNNGTVRLRMWKMGYPPTLIHNRTFEDRYLEIYKVDEQFVVANRCIFSENVYFFSTETLDEFSSLYVMHKCKWQYDRGLLFQYRGDGIVRILDVATGTFFNDLLMPIREEGEGSVPLLSSWASSNSNVVVIGWKYKQSITSISSHLSVYDLEAVKKRNSDPGSHLLYTLQFQCDIYNFVMNESEIAFSGNGGKRNRSVTVLKFANFSFDERKSPELKANEDIKMKIIHNGCVDSYLRYKTKLHFSTK